MEDNSASPNDAHADQPHELKEWETPTLVTEDIETITRGGSFTFFKKGDDAWYKS